MKNQLAWQDHAIILIYLAGMIAMGGYLALKQFRSGHKDLDREYFLAGRRMPWFAVGMSVIASLLSSLTYLSEPGEVWNSGITHVFGKMIAIPIEIIIVWVFCIPFMMRFKYTSAYEYLEQRFGRGSRLVGVVLFLCMVVLWMGFVVLASARALSVVSGVPLLVVIVTVGFVATVYTMLGGLRAVIWTDVVQVILLIGGGLFTIGYVMYATGTWIPQWYAAAVDHLENADKVHAVPLVSFSPLVRTSVFTVALSMCIWHVCTHTANQMTVQRYYSTNDMRAARRSFMTCSFFSVGLNLMLVVAGLAVLYFYYGQDIPVDQNLDVTQKRDRDLLFPTFAINQLPPGLGGAILAALLAAAMSSIDSGINSIATIVTVEMRRKEKATADSGKSAVIRAMIITTIAGIFITCAAYWLNFLPKEFGIVDSMPRTFNAITGPLGGLFLVGMFIPWAGGRSAVLATICGLLTSLGIGYFQDIAGLLVSNGVLDTSVLDSFGLIADDGKIRSLSFTWVMPCSLLVVMTSAAIFGLFESGSKKEISGLTWYTRKEDPPSNNS